MLKIICLALITVISGCASYTTPGGSISFNELAEADVIDLMNRKPASSFPANIAIARVQAPSYSNYRFTSHGTGRYSLITTREIETDKDLKQLAEMPMVAQIGWLNKLFIPNHLDSIKALRLAAARIKSDILLIYSFDTSFHVGEQQLAPLNTILLGFLDNKDVSVVTTVSAAFFDVRTEYLYGLSEASSKQSDNSSIWSTQSVVDDLRVTTEKEAFKKLIPEIEKTWKEIVRTYQKNDIINDG